MKPMQKSLIRLKDMLKQDKELLSLPLLNMIKSDVYGVFNNYFSLSLADIEIFYHIDEDGNYVFNVNAKSSKLKKIKFFND